MQVDAVTLYNSFSPKEMKDTTRSASLDIRSEEDLQLSPLFPQQLATEDPHMSLITSSLDYDTPIIKHMTCYH